MCETLIAALSDVSTSVSVWELSEKQICEIVYCAANYLKESKEFKFVEIM